MKFLEPHARQIVIGETDSMSHSTDEQFRRLGIYELTKRFSKVEAVNLMRDEILDLEVPSPHVINHLPIPRLVHDCDLLVNIPKVGTHHKTLLTCAFKNLFGLLAERRKYSVYHPLGVDKVIADLAKIVRSDLNIVDARDEVIVGVDSLPVDILAPRYVGLDPTSVEHLKLISDDRHLKLEDTAEQLDMIKIE